MPRAKTGALVNPAADGLWRGRVTKEGPDGSTSRPLYSLGTADKALAKKRLAALAAAVARGEDVVSAAGALNAPECVLGYADRWLDRRTAQGVGMVNKERRVLEMYVFQTIGKMALPDVRRPHIIAILDDAVALGKKQKTVREICGAMNRLFQSAVVAELISVNPVKDVPVPKLRGVKKKREILTDDEFVQFVVSPSVDLELKMLALSARCEGGMRTSDLHHWEWTQIDVRSFEECFIPRSKTLSPQRLVIPEALRPFLRTWWERGGRPFAGPVFPVRRGKRLGEAKKLSSSYAKRLRRDLFRAGVYRLPPVEVPAKARGKRKGLGEKEGAQPTRLVPHPNDPLYFESASTLPVDFHSFRRAFSTALAEVGTNVQHAMTLTSHSDPKVHMDYLTETRAMRTTPEGALPRLPPATVVLNTSTAPVAVSPDADLEPSGPGLVGFSSGSTATT